ncbi:MAG: ABC transporter ATP-binding protein [Pseudomonadota bacterium]
MTLELDDVYKTYQVEGATRTVLRGVHLRVERGDTIGILGRNGAGKSTLVRILAGVEKPSHGKVRRRMSVSWPLGFQSGFLLNSTGMENIRFVARLYNRDPKRIAAFVDDLAEIGRYMYMPMTTYSSGMRTKLALALSLAFDFDCYLVDEALAVSDQRFNTVIEQRLRNAALVLITHAPSLVHRFCRRAAILDAGILTVHDDLDEALATYNAL